MLLHVEFHTGVLHPMAIAEYIAAKGSARMVGCSLNKCNLQDPPVPAYRVVNRNGLLTGKMHFANVKTMQEMLEAEGVKGR